ncbi:MAG: DoxX family protein [Saprospiraceae bacterium]|nr:DoxX family protein [Saprospiraceae bacterium]
MDSLLQNLPFLFITGFFAVLFLQSGLDKVLDYQGNLTYFRDHFKGSPLAGSVGILMFMITFLEVITGLVSGFCLGQIILQGASNFMIFSPALAGLSLLSLFLGQRLAKDYAGAAALVPYFLVSLIGLWLMKGG